jgi:hypothetical protein
VELGGAVTFDAGSSYEVPGLVVTGGAAIINGTLNFTDSIFVDVSATLVLETPATAVTVPRLVLGSSGRIQGTDSLIVTGTFDWRGGTLAGPGVTWIQNTATGFWHGFAKSLDARTLVNDATVTDWSGGTITLANGASLVNNGVLDQTSRLQANVVVGAGGGTFVNDGQFRKSGPGSTSIGVTFVNNAALEVVTGTLDFGGDFTVSMTGVLQGTGTLDVSSPATVLAFDGRVRPGRSSGVLTGLLTLLGTYGPGASSALDIELGGTTADMEFDRLAVSGAATLNGNLNVSLLGGFTPTLGDQFAVLTFEAVSGDFATMNLPTLSAGLVWQRSFTATSMVLSVVTAGAANLKR